MKLGRPVFRSKLAGAGVVHIEEAVAVGLAAHALAVHVEGDEFVDAVEVPAVVGRALVAPLDLAGLHVDGHGRAGVEVVALAQVAVPGRRVAGAEVGQAGLGIVGAAQPGRGAAGLPQVAGPALVDGAGDAVLLLVAVLVVDVAHVAFHGRAGPQQAAGLRVARLDAADHAELAARHAGEHHAVGNDGRGGGRVAGGIVVDLLLPHHVAGVLVERDQLGVQRGEDHEVVVQRSAAVDHVAAGHDALGQAVLVLPQLPAGGGVQRKDARVGRGDEHLAVHDHRLGLLAALLLAAEGEGPHGQQLRGVAGIDLLERRVALALGVDPPGEDVAFGCGFGLDHPVRDLRLGRRGGQTSRDEGGQELQLHGVSLGVDRGRRSAESARPPPLVGANAMPCAKDRFAAAKAALRQGWRAGFPVEVLQGRTPRAGRA